MTSYASQPQVKGETGWQNDPLQWMDFLQMCPACRAPGSRMNREWGSHKSNQRRTLSLTLLKAVSLAPLNMCGVVAYK